MPRQLGGLAVLYYEFRFLSWRFNANKDAFSWNAFPSDMPKLKCYEHMFTACPILALLDYVSSSWNCPSFVRVAIISEANAHIAFPGAHARTFFFSLYVYSFWFFLWIFVVFVKMGPHGSKKFKTLLPLQIAAESFQTSPEISSQWSSQKCCLSNFKILSLRFFTNFFLFVNIYEFRFFVLKFQCKQRCF